MSTERERWIATTARDWLRMKIEKEARVMDDRQRARWELLLELGDDELVDFARSLGLFQNDD